MFRSLVDRLLNTHMDWVVIISVFLLMALGLSAVYSVDLSRSDSLQYFSTQTIAIGLSFLLFFIAAFLHESWFLAYARHAYLAALALLVAVLFFGTSVRGTTGWFRVAGFSFQPSEFAKVAIVLLLAAVIAEYGRRFYSWQFFITMVVGAGSLAGLILLQPDLGSASVIIGIWFLLIVAAKIPWKVLLGIVLCGVSFAILAWFFVFAPYQKDRVLTFIDPSRDPLGSGYNVQQSIIAIGAGNFFGQGLGFGSQSQLHFLPEAQTDFIFSVIAEELGFIGASGVLVLYCILIYRALTIAGFAKTEFGAYVAIGIGAYFFIHVLFNVGAATGLLPVTGVTLPFVSYGGSSMLMSGLLAGILVSISRNATHPHETGFDA